MNEKIGPILRQAREAKDLSLERVALETHMREHYLRALEEGNFEAIPSEAQARGFLRAYAEYLDIDLNDLPSEPDIEPESAKQPPPPPPPIVEDKPTGDIQASEIFQDVGRRLREQRELLGLSLEDVERHTHLRDRYLVALESGDLEKLPSPVQGRGMLNNYAIFLGLDPEPLLLRFAEGLQARLSASQARQPQDQTQRRSRTRLPTPLRRLLSGDILIGGTLAVLLVIFIIWGAIRIFAIQTEQVPTPTAPSIAEVLLASATPSPTPTSLPATPTPPPPGALFPTQAIGTNVFSGDPFPQNAEGDVQIYLTVYQRSWIEVVVDDEEQFDGRVIPGSAYAFTGLSRVEIKTGNGAGINVFFNEQNLGPMGSFGQVVHNIYSVEGVLAPTATITPTPTETLPASSTPLPSATPRPGEATVPSNP
jgi:cytoskeletal protein RodZ